MPCVWATTVWCFPSVWRLVRPRAGAGNRLALANIGLDLLGQARNFLTYAAELEGQGDEDTLAFGRDERQFRNVLLVEQPNGNFADTIARQYLMDAWNVALYERLTQSRDGQLAAIAAKAIKEARYHLRFSRGWLVRLGDGTETSAQNAAGHRQSVALYRAVRRR
jgi:ring-1,2-phenylacetyl-CoA epoxidase subunit PaaC